MKPLTPSKVFVPVPIGDDEEALSYVLLEDPRFVIRLKEQSLYVFTREELEKILGKTFSDGTSNGMDIASGNRPKYHSDKEYTKELLP
jgi:hypothetical protein